MSVMIDLNFIPNMSLGKYIRRLTSSDYKTFVSTNRDKVRSAFSVHIILNAFRIFVVFIASAFLPYDGPILS